MNKLSEINFSQIVSYQSEPPKQHWHNPPCVCDKFCIACEEENIVPERIYLDKLSHGCHSDVFHAILGEINNPNPPIENAVLFLLESPGADSFGDKMTFNHITKTPPVNHYYFAPRTKEWPKDINEVKNGYGDQFAYLIKRFNLRNAYFTNVIKCGKTLTSDGNWESFKIGNKDDRKIAKNCFKTILSNEIEIFNPDVIFSFGENAFSLFDYINTSKITHWQLNHPAKRMNLQENIAENESKIQRLLTKEGIYKQ